MIARRTLIAAIGAAALPAGGHPARADETAPATAFVERMLTQLLAILNGPQPIAQKRQAVARIVETSVDVEGVARFCLGRFWRTATAQQRADYVQLFRAVLVRNVTGNLGEYQGVAYTLGATTRRPEDVAVSTVVTRPGNAPNRVDWVVGLEAPLRLIDVIAEGTSLRLTQRSDYAAFISRNGNSVQALIDALRQQAAAGST